jgi:ssDNA-binding Zn-finger/Zn-ribbon topoisomerase 1
VYYDTDGIREDQYEAVRDCPDCPGLLRIRTRAEGGEWSECLHVPLNACPRCADLGAADFAKAVKNRRKAECINRPADTYERSDGRK